VPIYSVEATQLPARCSEGMSHCHLVAMWRRLVLCLTSRVAPAEEIATLCE
jgi:hypothetical protein